MPAAQSPAMGCGASKPVLHEMPAPIRSKELDEFDKPAPAPAAPKLKPAPAAPKPSPLIVQRSDLESKQALELEKKIVALEDRRTKRHSHTDRSSSGPAGSEDSAATKLQSMSRGRQVGRAETTPSSTLLSGRNSSGSKERQEVVRAERKSMALQRQRAQQHSMPILLRADDQGYKGIEADRDALHRLAICGPSPAEANRGASAVAPHVRAADGWQLRPGRGPEDPAGLSATAPRSPRAGRCRQRRPCRLGLPDAVSVRGCGAGGGRDAGRGAEEAGRGPRAR